MRAGTLIADRFEVEAHAGAGGMGAVYRARDRTSGATVALKLLHSDDGSQDDRFVREVRALEGLSHPAIARYVQGYGRIEVGEDENCGFVVRAIGYGGLDFEDDRPDTLAEAMTVLEAGLARWFEEQSVGPDD